GRFWLPRRRLPRRGERTDDGLSRRWRRRTASGRRGPARVQRSQQPPDEDGPRIERELFFPLDQEQVRDRMTQASGQRRGVDAVVHLDITRRDAQELGEQEERE